MNQGEQKPKLPPVLEEFIPIFASRAKKLLNGMRERTGRDPDIADFAAAFRMDVEKRTRPGLGS